MRVEHEPAAVVRRAETNASRRPNANLDANPTAPFVCLNFPRNQVTATTPRAPTAPLATESSWIQVLESGPSAARSLVMPNRLPPSYDEIVRRTVPDPDSSWRPTLEQE